MRPSRENHPHKPEDNGYRQEALERVGLGILRHNYEGYLTYMDTPAREMLELADGFVNPSRLNGIHISRLLIPLYSSTPLPVEIPEEGTVYRSIHPILTFKGNAKWIMQDSYQMRDPQNGEEVIQIVLHALYPPSIQLPRGGGRFRTSLPASGLGGWMKTRERRIKNHHQSRKYCGSDAQASGRRGRPGRRRQRDLSAVAGQSRTG